MNSVFHVNCNPLDANDECQITNVELFNFDGFVKIVLPIKH
jgi:hypothetical protein